jgi:hypothetical protein
MKRSCVLLPPVRNPMTIAAKQMRMKVRTTGAL